MGLATSKKSESISERPCDRILTDHTDLIRLSKTKGGGTTRAQRYDIEGAPNAVEKQLMLDLDEVARAHNRASDFLAIDQDGGPTDVVDL